MRRRGWLAVSGVALLACLGAHACGGRTDKLTAINDDSESHFLASCHAGGCPEGLSCLLGVCTQSCGADAECTAWSPSAVCRPEPTSGGSACDVECEAQTDCAGLGAAFDCTNGVCRADEERAEGGFLGSCTNNSCSEGLSCVSGQCTRPCQQDSDCGSGAGCADDFEYVEMTFDRYCMLPCEIGATVSPECASLGDRGRCALGACRQVFGGQCGDVGQPGAEWACYEDIAADVLRERQARLLDDEVCLPARDSRIYDVDYRLCPEALCASGASGCAITGLVLETQPTADTVDLFTSISVVVAAQGEVRLREPMNVRADLLDPLERCEYSVGVRYWDLKVFNGYGYLSASDAAYLSRQPENILDLSADAIQSGLWQATHGASFGHVDLQRPRAVIIEDSEAEVELLSGGERCTLIQELIGVRVRTDLSDVINLMLETWAYGVGDTIECLPCGAANCELACRHR